MERKASFTARRFINYDFIIFHKVSYSENYLNVKFKRYIVIRPFFNWLLDLYYIESNLNALFINKTKLKTSQLHVYSSKNICKVM